MDSDNGVEGQRIASSMSDHVQLLLDLNQKNLDGQMDGTPMSEHQVAILKRALAAGEGLAGPTTSRHGRATVNALSTKGMLRRRL